jgi:ABC-2 type transport system ATP-binding protein
VLLFDEPASGMDPQARMELREILRELGKLNRTILISSHILPELADICTHLGVIRKGKMIAEGPLSDFSLDGSKLEDVYLQITEEDQDGVA